MKTCFTSFSRQEWTLRECADRAVKEGFHGLEIRGKDCCHISPDSPEGYIRDAAAMLSDCGLFVPCVTGYTRFAQPDMQSMHAQVETVKRYAELCVRLGAPGIRSFMGAWPEGMELARAQEMTIRGLQLAAEALAGSGVRLLLETHDSVKSGAILAPLLEQVGDEVGVLLDIAHPYDAGECVGRTLELIGSRIHHVHIKDFTHRVNGVPVYCEIGKGVLPVRETVRSLRQAGYEAYFCLEWEKGVPEAGSISFDEQLASFKRVMEEEA